MKFRKFIKNLLVALTITVTLSSCSFVEVKDKMINYTLDSMITFQVKIVSIFNGILKLRKVSVSTDNRVVTLSGHVNSAEDLDLMIWITNNINKVRKVINKIIIDIDTKSNKKINARSINKNLIFQNFN